MSSCTLSSLAVTYGYLPPKVMVLKTMLLTVARVKTYEPIYMILITVLTIILVSMIIWIFKQVIHFR